MNGLRIIGTTVQMKNFFGHGGHGEHGIKLGKFFPYAFSVNSVFSVASVLKKLR